MKKLLFLSVVLTLWIVCPLRGADDQVRPADEDPVFLSVEEMPQFKGGDINDFKAWVERNISIPLGVTTSTGKARVQFIVEKDGSVSNVQILEGLSTQLDKAVTDAIKSSPKWKGGKQRNTPVRVKYTMQVSLENIHSQVAKVVEDDDEEYNVDNLKTFEGRRQLEMSNVSKTDDIQLQPAHTKNNE